LARVHHPKLAEEEESIAVAAESNQILVTCFHPELAQDSRIHRYFVERFVLRGADAAVDNRGGSYTATAAPAVDNRGGSCSASGTSAA